MVGRKVEVRFISRKKGSWARVKKSQMNADPRRVISCSTRWLANVGRNSAVERATTSLGMGVECRMHQRYVRS